MRCTIDGIDVRSDVPEEEAREYVKRAPRGTTSMKVESDGNYVNLWYYDRIPFERIRRITGYLSSLNRWNEAKTAELHDRVKHAVEQGK